jgi:hypothetical protein
MTRYAKRKLKYSLNENFNLLPYVEWDRFQRRISMPNMENFYYDFTMILRQSIQIRISPKRGKCTWNSNLYAKCRTERRFHALKFSDGYTVKPVYSGHRRFWKQCFQFNIVLLEIVLLFIKYLSLFICMFYSKRGRSIYSGGGGGGYVFFLKKYSDFIGGKKIIWFSVFVI